MFWREICVSWREICYSRCAGHAFSPNDSTVIHRLQYPRTEVILGPRITTTHTLQSYRLAGSRDAIRQASVAVPVTRREQLPDQGDVLLRHLQINRQRCIVNSEPLLSAAARGPSGTHNGSGGGKSALAEQELAMAAVAADWQLLAWMVAVAQWRSGGGGGGGGGGLDPCCHNCHRHAIFYRSWTVLGWSEAQGDVTLPICLSLKSTNSASSTLPAETSPI